VIGIGSYQLTNQTVSGNEFSLPAGAVWINLSFRTSAGSQPVSTVALTTGTAYLDIDSSGFASVSNTSSVDSIYSFTWTDGTDIIMTIMIH
jgi:hypothetical protein